MFDNVLVYLAGKIRKNDWRSAIVTDIRSIASGTDYILSDHTVKTIINSLWVSGPFFISCDHGCYHGDQSHGVGAGGCGCCGEGRGVPASVVTKVCQRQIDRSNFVFAYIEDETCFGTLCEIGYAIGKGIPVTVLFSSHEIRTKMWFIAEIANIELSISEDEFRGKEIIMLRSNVEDLNVNRVSLDIADELLLYKEKEEKRK